MFSGLYWEKRRGGAGDVASAHRLVGPPSRTATAFDLSRRDVSSAPRGALHTSNWSGRCEHHRNRAILATFRNSTPRVQYPCCFPEGMRRSKSQILKKRRAQNAEDPKSRSSKACPGKSRRPARSAFPVGFTWPEQNMGGGTEKPAFSDPLETRRSLVPIGLKSLPYVQSSFLDPTRGRIPPGP